MGGRSPAALFLFLQPHKPRLLFLPLLIGAYEFFFTDAANRASIRPESGDRAPYLTIGIVHKISTRLQKLWGRKGAKERDV